jgi:hypothetical protein
VTVADPATIDAWAGGRAAFADVVASAPVPRWGWRVAPPYLG